MKRIAVLVPCHNEAATIAGVVSGFRQALPMADIYVYDNCSTDATAQIARDSGAVVKTEPLIGKGPGKGIEHVIVATYSDYLKRPSPIPVPEFVAECPAAASLKPGKLKFNSKPPPAEPRARARPRG